jgi:hypothetical protein
MHSLPFISLLFPTASKATSPRADALHCIGAAEYEIMQN